MNGLRFDWNYSGVDSAGVTVMSTASTVTVIYMGLGEKVDERFPMGEQVSLPGKEEEEEQEGWTRQSGEDDGTDNQRSRTPLALDQANQDP